MAGFLGALVVLFLSVLMMRAMWRQMRKVNAHTAAQGRKRAEEQPRPSQPVERWDEQQGQYVPEAGDANEELLRMGARANAKGWYLDP